MGSPWKIAIWERENKVGKLFQYSGEVCQLLEQARRKNLTSVCLGDVDDRLKLYSVNLKDMVQFSEETGTTCQVHRLIYDETASITNKIMWEWQGDHQEDWYSYSLDITTFIEEAYCAKRSTVDLSRNFSKYPYVINFQAMHQINKRSKRRRPIRRFTTSPFPRVKIENGMEIDSISNSYVNCRNLVSAASQEMAAMDSSPKNKLIKQVSNLWNKLRKSDSESSSNSLAQKKLCVSKSGGSSQEEGAALSTGTFLATGQHGENLVYATVNGKPWRNTWLPNIPQSELKPVPGIEQTTEETRVREIESPTSTAGDIFVEFAEELQCVPDASDENPDGQICTICYDSLSNGSSYDGDSTLLKLRLCSHVFHKSCIRAMYECGTKNQCLQCPFCKTIHGIKRGIQPPGTMVYHVLPCTLPGYRSCETIRIIYNIHPGTQGSEHPNPGKRYSARGFPRHCFLPDNEMGRKVLRLLKTAWERRLIFTIGTSMTTGEQNTVTWNEIHHKTEFASNRRGHGFPDENFFDNIIAELAAHGVTESSYEWFPA